MSTTGNPRRPLPPSVYWRRRIVALVLLLVVIALIVIGVMSVVRGVAGLFDGKPAATQGAESPGSGSGGPTTAATVPAGTEKPGAGGTQEAGKACLPASVSIRAETDEKSYAAKAEPKLSLVVKNVSDVACTVEVGTAQQEFIIRSGNDRIWSSKDCEDSAANTEDASNVITFKAGDEKRSELDWKRIRSTEGCTAGLPDVKPGTYTLTTRLGKVESKAAAFVLK